MGDCREGSQACLGGGAGFGPCVGAVPPAAELCGGGDEDCDGAVDELPGLGAPCTAGEGACAVEGVGVCGAGGVECDAIAGAPRDETCDGVDEDCDGAVDEVEGVGTPCSAGVGACAAGGVFACDLEAGVPLCDAVEAPPTVERCGDGADDDCDGAVDEADCAEGCADDDGCRPGELCIDGGCVPAQCRDDLDCGGEGLCFAGACLSGDCRADAACAAGSVCVAFACTAADCDAERPCPEGRACVDGACGPRPAQGSLRLADGDGPHHGRVEIYLGRAWGTVCDDGFRWTEAQVVCRHLGFPGAVDAVLRFGGGAGEVLLDDVRCEGTEASLVDCVHLPVGAGDCGHTEDVGVVCERACAADDACLPGEVCVDGTCDTVAECEVDTDCTRGRPCIDGRCGPRPTQGDLRLADGAAPGSGRLEVYFRASWGTVCDDSFRQVDAEVACRQAGFPGAIGWATEAGDPGLPIWMDQVTCVGDEDRLADCAFDGVGIHNCAVAENVGVMCLVACAEDADCAEGSRCLDGACAPMAACATERDCPQQRACVDGQCGARPAQRALRLVRGAGPHVGELEAYRNEAWGSTCIAGFDRAEADVACRQLGFDGSVRVGPATDSRLPATLGGVACEGDEARLVDCPSPGADSVRCEADRRVELECRRACAAAGDCLEGEACVDGACLAGVACEVEADCPVGRPCVEGACGPGPSPGALRLRNPAVPYSGLVEVFVEYAWGTVCSVGFELRDADVVCRALGYPAAQRLLDGVQGQTEDPVWLRDLRCGGDEPDLLACGATPGPYPCFDGHSVGLECARGCDDAAGCLEDEVCAGGFCERDVACAVEADCPLGRPCVDGACGARPPRGALRLADGDAPHLGRLEIHLESEWGTVCDEGFDQVDADVACRQLGYPGAESFHARRWPGTGPILVRLARCSGDEAALADCLRSPNGSLGCDHADDIGVVCQRPCAADAECVEGERCLGGVCSTAECAADADCAAGALCVEGACVEGACRRDRDCDDGAICTANACQDAACGPDAPCPDDRRCAEGVCEARPAQGTLRLVGDVPGAGRVEVYTGDAFATVCDDGFGSEEAEVVCRQLGFEGAVRVLYRAGGDPERAIGLDDVMCVGDEARLVDCEHAAVGVHNCAHAEDVSVECR
ncbi:MAG: scavenger receptor cysteine-rich domain-containing protein [Myxococcales bacterium]|nr:scavenger receptor cysteine-rich domain-containing protein [Myxococcales bacterium]